MDDSHIDDQLRLVRKLFESRPGDVETGLDVDGAAMLQLRKACRLLQAARHLRTENGFHTVVIETSFAAMERTIQYYLMDNGFLDPEEYVDHREVYERSGRAGLASEEFTDQLVALWRNNRSRTYYREGVGSAARSTAMLDLAEAIHEHVLQLSGMRHECVCARSPRNRNGVRPATQRFCHDWASTPT